MMQYEFAILNWYREAHGYFYNYTTNLPLVEYNPVGGYPYALAELSTAGWQVVAAFKHEPHADNDHWLEVWLQRRGASDEQ